MLTIISHFYNEEYLLPWWLEHHKKIAPFGIMIDYHSTDRSVEIIKSICPHWEIRTTRNESFDAVLCDKEVQDIEKEIHGYKIALNTTEFLIGNVPIALQHYPAYLHLKSYVMCDRTENLPSYPTYDKPLIDQCHHGFVNLHYRQSRSMHRYLEMEYAVGRHSFLYDTELLAICWFGWAPFNEHTLKRKLQIKDKIPPEQFINGSGIQHSYNVEQLMEQYEYMSSTSYDLSPFIKTINRYGEYFFGPP